jgi:flagellar biosynthesis/type III secretory pathway protein FliH
LPAAEKTLFKQESMTTGGKKNLTLVKPNNPLFVPPELSGLFHEDLTDTPPVGAFQSGLPEKSIEVPGPLVQQAIARAIAGLSESQAFQAMDTTQMAKVNRLAHGVPKDVVSESQVDAQGLLEADAKAFASAKSKGPYAQPEEKSATEGTDGQASQQAGSSHVDGEGSAAQSDSDATSSETAPHDAKASASDMDGVDSEVGTDTTEAASPTLEATGSTPKGGDGSKVTGEVNDKKSSQVDPVKGQAPDTQASASDQPQESDQVTAKDDSAAGDDEAKVESLESSADALEAAEPDMANQEPVVDPHQQEIENYPVPEGMQLVSREDLEVLHAEAYESGRQAGLEESSGDIEAAVNASKETTYQEGYDKGYEEAYAKGEAAARDELQAEVELAAQDLKDLTQKLEEAAKDTEHFYAPLLKLAMHLAEQLVRGELTASGKAIAHLVETSLAEFENDPSSPILVKLNPEDIERIKAYGALLPKNAILKSDPTMFVGSVRVQINGAVIEDLIEQRSTALWQALTRGQDAGEPPPSFLKNLELMKEAFDEVDVEPEADQEPPLGKGETSLGQVVAPETIQADTPAADLDQALDEPISQESASEDLGDEELPSVEPIAEGLAEEEPREAVATTEDESSVRDSSDRLGLEDPGAKDDTDSQERSAPKLSTEQELREGEVTKP